MDDRAFLGAIIEHPDDDGPRLVYADWLDENGGTVRADFIRLQCDMAKRDPESVRWYELSLRANRLLQRFENIWLGELRPRVKSWQFTRGFVGRVTMSGRKFIRDAEIIF